MEPLTDTKTLFSSSSSSSDGASRRRAADEGDGGAGTGTGAGTAASADGSAAILALTRDGPVRELMMEMAIQNGYGLYCATDLTDAVRMLELELPGLVLADIDVPDGRALVRALHDRARDARWRNVPVLGLTATNNPMMGVALDVPVFFKPDLDGLETALTNRFSPRSGSSPADFPVWLGPLPSA
jgi:CheY-like chemotaxis protein